MKNESAAQNIPCQNTYKATDVECNDSGIAALQQQLALLQTEYESLLPDRLNEISRIMTTMLEDTHTATHYQKLHIAIHRLAGSGATFGYAKLSKKAQEIEHLVNNWLEEPPPLNREEVLKVEGLTRELFKYSEPHNREELRLFTARQSSVTKGQERLIYLVEDDLSLASDLALQLRHFGYEVIVFHDATSAQTAIENRHPDIMLIDMMLPEGDLAGGNMMTRYRTQTSTNFPIIIMSIRSDYSARLSAVRAGASAYMVKPLDMEILVEQIDRITLRKEIQPYRVLLIDDDLEIARHLDLTLRSAGVTTQIINHPSKALEVLDEFNPDLILLDFHLPGCNGSELASIIRQHENFLSIPIIYLSTETNIKRKFMALRMGGDEFLTKPINDEDLISMVISRAARARKLTDLIDRDSLSGLLKHTKIKDLLATEIKRQQRTSGTLSFAMIDLDHFKKINDCHGHMAGDRVIRSLAYMLKQRARESDIIGRYGGEEFALILPNCSLSDAAGILEKLRADFNQISQSFNDITFTVTFSAGIAEWKPSQSADELINSADKALYLAKEGGRNCIVSNSVVDQ